MTRGVHEQVHALDQLRRTRRRVAQQAARLISEDGIRDYRHAKLKAASQLGVHGEQCLPRNREIEDALREHQRLFRGDERESLLRDLRESACEAMEFLAPFHPRLVGPVLSGTADEHSVVSLHLFADAPEVVHEYLAANGIPFSTATRRLRMRRDHQEDVEVLQLAADGIPFELTLLPTLARRQAPLDRVEEKPMPRASVGAVRALLAESA